ncbi:MAG: DUF3150 domain-containing protein [Chromatiaceae bacterium]
MHAIERITDQLTLVVLAVHIWSGRKKLRPEDLKLGTDTPPEELVSLGSKRVYNPQALKVFHRIKKGAERACLTVGTRFLGGFAVPHVHADALAEKLRELKAEFDEETALFLSGYDRALEDWIATLPRWEEPIRRAIEPASVVGGRLRFGYQLIQIAPTDQPGTLEEEVRGLGDGIFAEVEQLAQELEESFEGREKLHRRALGTFRRIREKLASLSFVDPRIAPVVDTIDGWFARVPVEGPIAGPIFTEGMGLALLLSDADTMARHGAGQWSLQQGLAPVEPDTEEDVEAVASPAESEEPEPMEALVSLADFGAELDALFGFEPMVPGRQPETEAEEPAEAAALDVESFYF